MNTAEAARAIIQGRMTIAQRAVAAIEHGLDSEHRIELIEEAIDAIAELLGAIPSGDAE